MSKELKIVFQYMDQKPRYLIKSIYSGSMPFYQIRSCPIRTQELDSISTETDDFPNNSDAQGTQMKAEFDALW